MSAEAAPDPSAVGVVGLGIMGGAMSANLVAAGFEVHGYDVDEAAVRRLIDRGGRAAQSVAQVARAADVVLLSLPSAAALEAVVGDLSQAPEGLIVVEAGTLPLDVKERARAQLAQHGVVLLDCPVSGTGDQAVQRDLVVLASGEREAVERCVPVFDGFARAHRYLGEFGSGTKMKLVANLLVAIHNVAAAEALALARAADLDLEQTLDVIAESAGTSRMFEVRGPKMVARDYAGGVRTTVFQKDLAIIDAFAQACGTPAPLLELCAELYAAAAASGHADDDTASVIETFGRRRRT